MSAYPGAREVCALALLDGWRWLVVVVLVAGSVVLFAGRGRTPRARQSVARQRRVDIYSAQ